MAECGRWILIGDFWDVLLVLGTPLVDQAMRYFVSHVSISIGNKDMQPRTNFDLSFEIFIFIFIFCGEKGNASCTAL